MSATKRSLDSGASDSPCYDRRDSTYAQGRPGSQHADEEASAFSRRPMDSIRGYGANLVVTGERYANALAAREEWTARTGALAFDQLETLPRQGTVGLEFEAQCPQLDTLLVAVGGGGLIGGISAWYAGRTQIMGVEPAAAPMLTSALEAGRPLDAEAGGIAADSLAPRRVGELMFPIAQAHVNRVVLVADDAIQDTQQVLWKVLRLVSEPGGGAAFAVVLTGQYQPKPSERVGVLMCGGNTTAVNFKGAASA